MSRSSGPFEFASPDWLSHVEKALAGAFEPVRDEPGLVFSYAERYTDVPPHLRRPDGNGYTARFQKGSFTFERKPSSDVDVLITADYHAILPRVRMVIADDPVRWSKGWRPIIEAGHLTVSDSRSFPGFLDGVHDVIARGTAADRRNDDESA